MAGRALAQARRGDRAKSGTARIKLPPGWPAWRFEGQSWPKDDAFVYLINTQRRASSRAGSSPACVSLAWLWFGGRFARWRFVRPGCGHGLLSARRLAAPLPICQATPPGLTSPLSAFSWLSLAALSGGPRRRIALARRSVACCAPRGRRGREPGARRPLAGQNGRWVRPSDRGARRSSRSFPTTASSIPIGRLPT